MEGSALNAVRQIYFRSALLSSHIKKLKIKIIKTVILPVVLYGCETCSLTLREEHRLRVFENRVLRIFGPKREEDGSWRKLHNDEMRFVAFPATEYEVLLCYQPGQMVERWKKRRSTISLG
jgi:hypothetical protein